MDRKINLNSLLSSLWVFILLNMLFRDMHQFANKGFIQELMTVDVSEELLLMAGIILEIPILMVVLSQFLKPKLNKWINLIAVAITVLTMAAMMETPDMDDIFFMCMEFTAFVAIAVIAWKLPAADNHALTQL